MFGRSLHRKLDRVPADFYTDSINEKKEGGGIAENRNAYDKNGRGCGDLPVDLSAAGKAGRACVFYHCGDHLYAALCGEQCDSGL